MKGADDRGRHFKMQALIRKAGSQLIRRRFGTVPELTASLYASLVEHLEGAGLLRTRPFDASACPLATLADISKEKLRWFLGRARRERQFALVADPLFLARYIEKAGTGTLDMIALCRAADLPEPEFRQDGGMFVQTLWRDWVTHEVLRGLDLNERQKKALLFVKSHKRIRNAEYQRFTGAIKKTASRDLEDLVARGIFAKVGTTGRGTYYSLARKGDIKGTKGTSSATVSAGTKEDKKGTKRTSGRRVALHRMRVKKT